MGIVKANLTVKAIREGKVLICPTDTVYGLVCDATNQKAVKKLFQIKQRLKSKPLPIFVKDISEAKKLAELDKDQEEFLKKSWPGKITAVLEAKQKIKVYGVGKKTIALRVPKYKAISDLLRRVKRPLTGTSANVSGQPASGNIAKVLKQFEKGKYRPDLVVSAGNLPKSNPSKIIDLTSKPYKILRP